MTRSSLIGLRGAGLLAAAMALMGSCAPIAAPTAPAGASSGRATPSAPAPSPVATVPPSRAPTILRPSPTTATVLPSPAVDLPAWTWTPARVEGAAGAGSLADVWSLPAGLVAVATAYREDGRRPATFLVSADGLAWRAVAFPEKRFSYETGLVRDGTLTVVGSVGTAKSPRRRLWQTTDGVEWTRVEPVGGLDFGPGLVSVLTHADAGWLAIGVEVIDPETQRAHLLHSTDARTWTEIGWPAGAAGRRLATDGHRWVLIARSPEDEASLDVLVSSDLVTWTTAHVAALPPLHSGSSLAGTASGFTIGGQRFDPKDESSHPLAWWSTDGITWAPSTVDGVAGPGGEAAMFQMDPSDGRLVASGNGDPLEAAMWLSDTGRDWVQVTPLPPKVEQVEGYGRAGARLVVGDWVGSDGVPRIWLGTTTP